MDRDEELRMRDATAVCWCRRGAFPSWRLRPRAREEEAIALAGRDKETGPELDFRI